MTYGELFEIAVKDLELNKTDIDDYRPYGVNAIKLWLKSGVEVIYDYEIYHNQSPVEEIDNAKLNEALECVDYIEKKLGGLKYECERTKNHRCDDLFIQEHIFTTIKQALIEAQKLEKAWEIVREKGVDVATFNTYQTLIEYNWSIRFEKYKRKELTQQEFELLKEML